jgi:hypothetical protein
VWRNLRLAFLLLLLGIAAYWNLHDRLSTTDWDETLWIGVFPINAEDSDGSGRYIEGLTPEAVADIERFINREAKRYGIVIARPVRVDLYPEVTEKPPPRAADAGVLANMWWSLKLRLYANRNSQPPGRAPPQIRIFVLYHDPTFTQSVPHSVGLQKGLVGVVHAYAEREMTRPNNVVIAHEILHTLGASDKYDLGSLAPLFPTGYAEPDRDPLYPQDLAEVMAGRYAIDAHTFEMPESLDEVRVGETTALEIRWVKAE